jgi:hypothetical protein
MPPRLRKRLRAERQREHPAAQLSVVRDRAYFILPPSFSPSDGAALSSRLAELADTTVRHVMPTYSRYCDADTFAAALLSPATKRDFWLLSLHVGAILVASGKTREFMAWRSSREQEIEADPNLSPEVRERNKQYLQALASRAIRR